MRNNDKLRSVECLGVLSAQPFGGAGRCLPRVDVDAVDDVVHLIPGLLVVVLEGGHVLHHRDVAVEPQQRAHCHFNQQREHSHAHAAPGLQVCVGGGMEEAVCGPGGHGCGVEVVGGVGEEEAEEGFVVACAYAVIEKAAVVVELFGAAVAAHAVVAVPVHLAVAHQALPHCQSRVLRRQLLLHHHPVHWIAPRQSQVVVAYCEQQRCLEPQHGPQDAVVYGGQRGDDEGCEGGELGGEEEEGDDLFLGGRLRVGVDFLVGSVLGGAWLAFAVLVWAEHGAGGGCGSILLMNGEKDSVVNFLTPTKLISTSLKPKQRLHPNDSLFSHSSRNRQDDPARNYNSQFDRLNYGFNRSQEEVDPARADLQDSREVYSTAHHNKNYLENPSKPALKSEDNFRLPLPDRAETRSEHPPQSSFVLYKVENTQEAPPPEPFVKLIQNSGIEEDPLRASGLRDRDREKAEEEKGGFAGYTQGLSSLILELKSVKAVIEGSLGELQSMLDNTSRFLQSMDEEYGRIKQRVLDFTAQALDAGFSRYRQGMVNWTKYEEVEVRSQLMLQQLDKTIREDEVVVEEMNKLAKNSRIIFSKQTELNEKIELYSNFVNELAKSKAECLSMRPQLKRERVLAFEEAVAAMADF